MITIKNKRLTLWGQWFDPVYSADNNAVCHNFNELPRGKPRCIFKGKIHFIAASCGELNPKYD